MILAEKLAALKLDYPEREIREGEVAPPGKRNRKSMDEADVDALGARILQAIRDELVSDPAKMGYGGKSAQEVLELLQGPGPGVLVSTVRVNIGTEESPVYENRDVRNPGPPRIHTIMIGVPHAPNAFDVDDIEQALKL